MDRQQNKYQRSQSTDWIRRGLFVTVLGVFVSFCLVMGTGLGLVVAFYDTLPSLAPLEDYTSEKWNLPSKIYSRDGQLLTTFYEERRELIKIEELPPEIIQAVISVEDARFFSHNGVDFQGIARAAYRNFQAGHIVEGGSTITQQLAKVLFLNPEQTFRRKIKEAMLALKIERTYTKKEILDRYFNKIYFGSGAYGIEAASKIYFGKSARNINVAEAALLAGLPKAPSYYSPFRNPERARSRHRTVLLQMARQGIFPLEKVKLIHSQFWKNYDQKRHELSNLTEKRQSPGAYFVEHIRQKLLNKYGANTVYRGGLEVWTTLEMDAQKKLETEMYDYLLALNIKQGNLADTASTIPRQPKNDLIQGGVYLKDPQNGEVLAMVGGHRWHLNNQLNRATQAYRQPGSAFKPILYMAAIDQGYTIGSRLQDRPLIYETPQGQWQPTNYTKKYYGQVTLRTALIHSLNVATVHLMEEIGPRTMIRYARKLGIQSPLFPHMSLALGGLRHGVSLDELVDVYSVFANKGLHTDAISIREIRDREGNVLERNFPFKRQVISPQSAFIMTTLLEHVVEEGTGRGIGAFFHRTIAGKTGTTNDYRDAWFVGYTPDLVMGAWFGYDSSNRSLGDRMSGGVVAGKFWRKAAQKIFENRPARTFSVPNSINYINIDPATGYLGTRDCPRTTREPYIMGTEPTERCPIHSGFESWS